MQLFGGAVKLSAVACGCALLTCPLTASAQSADFDHDTCTFHGIELKGRVKEVKYLPDVRVQVVDYLPDLRVQKKSYLPTACGEWQMVESFPDFTIQYVDYLPDVKVQFVDAFPGTR